MSWLQALLDGVVGLVIGTVLAEPFRHGWSSTTQLVWRGRGRPISGRWRTKYWNNNSASERVEHYDIVHLEQWGIYISGWNDGDTDHHYKLEGRFRQPGIVSGTWRSVRQESSYHGTFQLQVSVDGKTMRGCWSGNSNSGRIVSGEWVWQRESQ
jgi:hypothetical protein